MIVKPGAHTNDFAPVYGRRAKKLGHASLAMGISPRSADIPADYLGESGQRPYRLRRSTIGTSHGGVALQWRRLCGCVHEGAMARPWTGNGQFCSAINCNNRRKTCTSLSFFRFPVKLLCM